MLSGSAVDVAIGVILLLLVSSLLSSAVVEIVGGFFHRRSKNLWDTIDLMLGGAKSAEEGAEARKLVDRIYRQPFVTALVQPKAQRFYPQQSEGARSTPGLRSFKPELSTSERRRRFHGPQHIDPRSFAEAFIAAVHPGGTVETDVAKLKERVAGLPESISKPLGTILDDVSSDFVAARERIERWYVRHMDAVSVWYRRQTRYFLFIAGLVIAVAGNIDAIAATKTLYNDKSVRESVVAQAGAIGLAQCETEQGADAQVDCLREQVGGAVSLPVGWSDLDRSSGAWVLRVLGWVLVAGAVTLGAPFWFDLFRRALAHRKPETS